MEVPSYGQAKAFFGDLSNVLFIHTLVRKYIFMIIIFSFPIRYKLSWHSRRDFRLSADTLKEQNQEKIFI